MNTIGYIKKTVRFFLNWAQKIIITLRFLGIRQLQPISCVFGFDRGIPIDRYYIENFLAECAGDIKDHVLEIGDNTYTMKYGGKKVSKSDVLHATPDNTQATFIGDLTKADNIPSNTFDCLVLTQTLQFIYGMPAAINTIHRILKPGGVVLATASGVSQISRCDMDQWGEYWRLTTLSAQKLFCEYFPDDHIDVRSYGNVLVAISFLHGLATHELTKKELDYRDRDYQVLITIRAVKPKENICK